MRYKVFYRFPHTVIQILFANLPFKQKKKKFLLTHCHFMLVFFLLLFNINVVYICPCVDIHLQNGGYQSKKKKNLLYFSFFPVTVLATT